MKLGYVLMNIGLELAKKEMTPNMYWAFRSLISDARFLSQEKLSYKVIDTSELVDIARKQLGDIKFYASDSEVYYCSLDAWRKIIKADLVDRIFYQEEKFDCDNFALVFSSFMSLLYGLNSAGIATGIMRDAKTKEIIGGHAYNILVADVDGEVKLFVYEPQNDDLVEASNSAQVGGTLYETKLVWWR